jgi:hypothetical protein
MQIVLEWEHAQLPDRSVHTCLYIVLVNVALLVLQGMWIAIIWGVVRDVDCDNMRR